MGHKSVHRLYGSVARTKPKVKPCWWLSLPAGRMFRPGRLLRTHNKLSLCITPNDIWISGRSALFATLTPQDVAIVISAQPVFVDDDIDHGAILSFIIGNKLITTTLGSYNPVLRGCCSNFFQIIV